VDEFNSFHLEDNQVLIAKDLNVQKWFRSGANEGMGHVFVVAVFKNEEVLTDATIAALWIVKIRNKAHELVATEVAFMFGNFHSMHGNLWLAMGGGNITLPGTVSCPDGAVSP
jgi:hypothetical protein